MDTNCQFAELSPTKELYRISHKVEVLVRVDVVEVVKVYNERTTNKKAWKTSGIVEKDKKTPVVIFLACLQLRGSRWSVSGKQPYIVGVCGVFLCSGLAEIEAGCRLEKEVCTSPVLLLLSKGISLWISRCWRMQPVSVVPCRAVLCVLCNFEFKRKNQYYRKTGRCLALTRHFGAV